MFKLLLFVAICSWQFMFGMFDEVALDERSDASFVEYLYNLTVASGVRSKALSNLTLIKKCFEDLECLTNEDFLDTLKKENLLFDDPEDMDVKFILYTPDTPNSPEVFNYNPPASELGPSYFDSNLKTRFIVHGWMDEFNETGLTGKMKDFFLDNSDCNVVGVDWRKLANSLIYIPSVLSAPAVGEMIATFIQRLVAVKNANPKNMHCAGHSLGAQICGLAGQSLQEMSLPKWNEISGLDPAGPLFTITSDDHRLDKTDAELLVVMHTNAGLTLPFLGYYKHLGHFDFWINGGELQPDCPLAGIIPPCSHDKAKEYAISSPPANEIEYDCQHIGYECESYEKFKKGLCADCGADGMKCKPMEFNPDYWDIFDRSELPSENQEKDYYLETEGTDPFCLYHYQIHVTIAQDSPSLARGKLQIMLEDKKLTVPVKSRKSDFYQLYVNRKDLALPDIQEIEVKWTSKTSSTKEIKVEMITFNYMSNLDESVREEMSNEYCPDPDNHNLVDGETHIFSQCSLRNHISS